jgi:hypothetical protein
MIDNFYQNICQFYDLTRMGHVRSIVRTWMTWSQRISTKSLKCAYHTVISIPPILAGFQPKPILGEFQKLTE